jgi:micrococcal nuclease
VNKRYSSGRPNADCPDSARPYTKRPGLGAIAFLVIALLIAARYAYQPDASAPPEAIDEGFYTVQRVVDGDTLLLADGVRLRMIGINCPESVKPDSPVELFGPEASTFTRECIGQQQVKLQFDREREDQYGRMLAYVYVGKRLLNEELLRAGLARFEAHFHYSDAMKRRFRAAQDEAREAHRGIWSK